MDNDLKVIDLTHTLSENIPAWDGSYNFKISIETDYKDCTPPDLFRTQKIQSSLSMGTHIDAPAHCVPGAKTIDALDMQNLITRCIVINVAAEVERNENYVITPEVIEKFEKENGGIEANTFVIFYTGWGKYWPEPEKYHSGHKFPSVSAGVAELLLQRNIAGLGTDTLSADTGTNGFPVHRAILGAGKYLVENIANVEKLPITGAQIFVLPIKIKDATEAPVRLIAVV